MADLTKIEWCDATLNLWWGCTKVSDGCKFCYANDWDSRYHPTESAWGPTGKRREVKSWRSTLNKISKRAKAENRRLKVFCQSMSDTFEGPETMGGVDSENWKLVRYLQDRLFEAIWVHHELDFLILTKRPDNALKFFEATYQRGFEGRIARNTWIGASVENQATADERIPHLLRIPAAVRFLSCEPLLGPVDLSAYIGYNQDQHGGESGGIFVSSGHDGAVGNRLARPHLEDCGTPREPLEQRCDDNTCTESEGGTQHVSILPSAVDGERQAGPRACASPSVEARQRPNPDWDGDQSFEREQAGQSPRKPRVDYPLRESQACSLDEIEDSRRGAEPVSETAGHRCCSDPSALCEAGPASDPSRIGGGIWSESQDNIKDRARRPPCEARRSDSGLHKSPSVAQSLPIQERQRYISQVIVGGESGPNARPMHPDWARSLRDQCQAAEVPFFFKQWGEWLPRSECCDPDTRLLLPEYDHLEEIWRTAPFGSLSEDGAFAPEFTPFSDEVLVTKIGKARAGRLLDGREWNEFPEVSNG